mgnify:CR=1 FL=1
MPNIKEKLWKINTARRIVQFLFFLIFCGTVFGLTITPILLPVMWTLGTSQKTVGDAFAALQWMLYDVIFPWIPIASFLIAAILLGRALCGWVCPFGFVQDVLELVKRRHKEFPDRTHQSMLFLKYFVLGTAVFVSATLSASLALGIGGQYKRALGVFAPAPFNVLSPADTLFAVVPRLISDFRYAVLTKSFWEILSGISTVSVLLWIRFLILFTVLAFAIYVPRAWCKYLCPHGAVLAFLNWFSFLGLKRDPVKCTKADCRSCVEACPMKVRILDMPWEKFTDPECIYCLKCIDACPTKAIKPKAP